MCVMCMCCMHKCVCGMCVCSMGYMCIVYTSVCTGVPTLHVSMKVIGGSWVSCPMFCYCQPYSLEAGSLIELGAGFS